MPCLTVKPKIELNFTKRVFVKENVIPQYLCDEIIEFGKNNVVKGVNKYPGLFQISFNSCLLPLDHSIVHSLLQEVWDEASSFIGTTIDFVEPYELKQYNTNDFFSKHTDNYNSLSEDIDRKITMSIQLSDDEDYVGGDLLILSKPYSRKKGSIIAFPSLFSHQVTPIVKGERWSLISWAWGPEWK
jgi:hypothetical protein